MIAKINIRGFTLIETIVYIAILTFLIASGFMAAFYIIDSSGKNKTDVNVQAEGNFIVRKIDWALTGASSVSVGATTLSITKDTSAGFPASQNPIVFSLNGSNLQLARGAGAAATVNSSYVAIAGVGGVIFTDTPAVSGKPEAVSANFTVNGSQFSITKYLRK